MDPTRESTWDETERVYINPERSATSGRKKFFVIAGIDQARSL
jgi:hypothetical protein